MTAHPNTIHEHHDEYHEYTARPPKAERGRTVRATVRRVDCLTAEGLPSTRCPPTTSACPPTRPMMEVGGQSLSPLLLRGFARQPTACPPIQGSARQPALAAVDADAAGLTPNQPPALFSGRYGGDRESGQPGRRSGERPVLRAEANRTELGIEHNVHRLFSAKPVHSPIVRVTPMKKKVLPPVRHPRALSTSVSLIPSRTGFKLSGSARLTPAATTTNRPASMYRMSLPSLEEIATPLSSPEKRWWSRVKTNVTNLATPDLNRPEAHHRLRKTSAAIIPIAGR